MIEIFKNCKIKNLDFERKKKRHIWELLQYFTFLRELFNVWRIYHFLLLNILVESPQRPLK